jgi:hypothetical protein
MEPCFFAIYSKSTPGLAEVARLIQYDYHDARRTLVIVIEEGWRPQT